MSIARDLDDYLAGWRSAAQFDWSARNCAHFAGGWWRRVTGRDPLVGLGMPASAATARRWLRSRGGSLAAVITARTGVDQFAVEWAAVGDVVLVSRPSQFGIGEAIGICAGRHLAALGLHGQPVFLPMTEALAAWPVEPS